MNQWCLWRAEQLRLDGEFDRAEEWTDRARNAAPPDPTFVWPRGHSRDSAVKLAQASMPGMPDDADDFWVLGALNTVLSRSDSGNGNPNHAGDGKFSSGGGGGRGRIVAHNANPHDPAHHVAAFAMTGAANAKSEVAHGHGMSHGSVDHHRAAGEAHRDAAVAHENLGNKGAADMHWKQNGEHHAKADYIEAHAKASIATSHANRVNTEDAHYAASSAHDKAYHKANDMGDNAAADVHAAFRKSHADMAWEGWGKHKPKSDYR